MILVRLPYFQFRVILDNHLIGQHENSVQKQILNMHDSILETELKLLDTVQVKQKMMALRHLPFGALATFEVEAKKTIQLTFENEIEAPLHLREVEQSFHRIDRPHTLISLLNTKAKSPSGKIELGVSNSFIFEESHDQEPKIIHEEWDENRYLMKFSIQLEKGQTYQFSVVSTVCTSVHFKDAPNEAKRLALFAKLEGRECLIHRHQDEWAKLWKNDIEIQGDEQVQKDIRFLLYHLYAFTRENSGLSLSPMGLSGLEYNGHIFWDCELWMYPALLMMNLNLAKSLLDYRYDRLESAKQNAFTHGYKGAMFPWESADTGYEESPVWALTGPFQQHITACVGWAFWKNYQVTQDKKWLAEKGWEVLKEVAEFWVDRVERNGEGNYEINNVIGANEFEENIDNNAFTNGIVKLVLRYATQAGAVLGKTVNPDWLHISENIPVLQFEDGTTRENRTYDGAIIKQSDVNLLSYPLRFISDNEQIKKDLDFYEPRISPEGPAMGVSILATLHALLGNTEKAYQLFLKSYRPNQIGAFGVMAECADGKGVSPFFITGAGGTLQTILAGFAGLEITDNGLVERPQNLLAHWQSLKVNLNWKNQ